MLRRALNQDVHAEVGLGHLGLIVVLVRRVDALTLALELVLQSVTQFK